MSFIFACANVTVMYPGEQPLHHSCRQKYLQDWINIVDGVVSWQELVAQELEGAGGKSCFRCKRSTRYICSKHILQPPKYLIIIVNHLRYVSNQFIKNRILVPLNLTFMIGSNKFSLQASIDHLEFCIVVIVLLLSTVARKHFIAMTTKLPYVI